MKPFIVLWILVFVLPISSCATVQDTYVEADSNSRHPTSDIRTDLVQHANDLIGSKYKYGGTSPRSGFDCSGLVQYLYQNAGLSIVRRSRDQATQGEKVSRISARPGDLVFFKKGGKIFHVAVVELSTPEELWVIHSTTSKGVIKEDILASSYWAPKLHGIKDVIE